MPRAKAKPKPRLKPQPQPAVLNGPSSEVLTLAEAAAYLRLSEQHVIAAASSQGLPGRFVGGEWRFLKPAIQQWLSASQPTAEMRKAATLTLIEKDKDDGGWEELREAIARNRRRLDEETRR